MAERPARRLTLDQRREQGEEAVNRTPLTVHEGWVPTADRPDPITLLEEQERTREPDLVPVRHGRMLVSPFTFFRGAAKIMTADLAATPTAGLTVQLCGDAHLCNFGGYGSPERRLLFDVNDFDETLPGPFEYDVKRLAASVTVCGQGNGFAKADVKTSALMSVAAYREAMREFAQMRTLDVWYASLSEDDVRKGVATDPEARSHPKEIKRGERSIEKARTRDSMQALSKLAERVDGTYRIVSRPPLVVPLRELATSHGMSRDEVETLVREQFIAYRRTIPDDRRQLLDRFQVVDMARKVVGVGSVGTWAFIVLLQGRDDQDPLFLQVKQATASVLEDHLSRSRYQQHGERVVQGQRLMQAASDIFLGWTHRLDATQHFYWRQLRDMKGSAPVDEMSPTGLMYYAGLCGWTLARAHARSGDPVAISAYLGETDAFDHAVEDFAKRYAEQNERDHQALLRAIDSGRLPAEPGL